FRRVLFRSDGIIAALQMLQAMARSGETLAQQVGDLHMYPQKMVNVPLEPGVDWQHHAGLSAAKLEVERMLDGRGRVLIRASGTEPKLRLMVEAEDETLAQKGVDQLVAVNLQSV